jgi:hypothetical protein
MMALTSSLLCYLFRDNYEGFIDHYEEYLTATKQSLDSQLPATFTPELSALDAMMASLKVENP